MATKRAPKEDYFCIIVKRDYEDVWRVIGKYASQDAAEAELQEKRSYKGSFNYDNAELRVISRAEGKKQFGADWEYHPIGEKPSVTKSAAKSRARAKAKSEAQ